MTGYGEEIRVRVPKGKEVLGVIETMLGASRMRVRCQDDKIRTCRVPGRFRKRLWIRQGDYILVIPWEIQGDTNGDIVWKYRPNQADWLKRKGILKL
ncbi:translation initiation factor eIF-1A [Candidatus Aenigmatarchaeota archaeon]